MRLSYISNNRWKTIVYVKDYIAHKIIHKSYYYIKLFVLWGVWLNMIIWITINIIVSMAFHLIL